MANRRKGAGKGTGKGYRNLRGFPRDSTIHKESGQGKKQPQRLNTTLYRDQGRNKDAKLIGFTDYDEVNDLLVVDAPSEKQALEIARKFEDLSYPKTKTLIPGSMRELKERKTREGWTRRVFRFKDKDEFPGYEKAPYTPRGEFYTRKGVGGRLKQKKGRKLVDIDFDPYFHEVTRE